MNIANSKDLLINDIFYKSGREPTRIPYEVLLGIRTLLPEDKDIQEWLQTRSQIKIEYVYKGKCINVEHGHYLKGIILYIKKNEPVPDDIIQIKRELYEKYKFAGIDTKEHSEWGIPPEQAIMIVKLEDELRSRVDSFIYDKMKIKAKQFRTGLEFTSLDLARRSNQNYEYRLCYPNEEELKKHDYDGSNQAFTKELEKLICMNNYVRIYDDISPVVRFIIRT